MFTSGQFKAIYPNSPKELPTGWSNIINFIDNYIYNHTLLMSNTDYLEYFITGWEHQALIYSINKELKEEKKIKVSFTTHTLSKQDQDNAASNLQCFKNRNASVNTETDRLFDIHYIKHGIGIFGILDKMEHLTELKHISLLLQKNTKHRVRVYSNILDNTITIITNAYELDMVFKLLGLCNRLFQDIIFTNVHLLNMLEAAGKQDYALYLQAFNHYVNDTNLLKNFMIKKLEDVLTISDRKKLKDAESNLKTVEREIVRFERDLEHYYNKRKTHQKTIMMYTLLKEQTDLQDMISELLDYIDANKCIRDVQMGTEGFKIEFVSPIKYYDKELLETIFERNPQTLKNDYVRQFLREVFIEEKYQLLMTTIVNINPANTSAYCSTTTDKLNSNGYLNQTHLMRHNCWGDNSTLIKKQIQDNNYLIAFNQITAATMGFNIGDSVVFRALLEQIEWTIQYKAKLKVIDNETQEEINYIDKINFNEESINNDEDEWD